MIIKVKTPRDDSFRVQNSYIIKIRISSELSLSISQRGMYLFVLADVCRDKWNAETLWTIGECN